MSGDVPKSSPFSWSAARIEAAILLAADRLSDEEIASKVGVTRRGMAKWKCVPEFQARIQQHRDEFEESVAKLDIASRRRRVGGLDRLHSALFQVIDARSVEYAEEAPGAETGLLVKQLKVIGAGENQQVIEEWVVDTGTINEIRALQKQAAQELGQWSEKASVTHSGGIRREIVVVTDADTGPIDVTNEASFADIEADLAQLRDEHPEDAL